ncbi:YafY family transcriptional regulator [Rhodobacteraceae bacterium]|nr:YafY family transcriptional regulator [Paracoccaceae bacterium]
MRRAERLFRIVNELRTRRVTRAIELADTFEVSVSTIYRDIAHLQGSGVPIDGEAGIGYILRPGFDLPNLAFTYDQLDALAVGLAFVERVGDPELATAAKEVRAKIQAGLPTPEKRVLADAPYFNLLPTSSTPAMVTLLRRAIRHQLIVEFTYTDKKGAITTRRIEPVSLQNITEGWMLSGWCDLRGDFRTFRVDLITHPTVTDIRFKQSPERSLKAFLEKVRAEQRHASSRPDY